MTTEIINKNIIIKDVDDEREVYDTLLAEFKKRDKNVRETELNIEGVKVQYMAHIQYYGAPIFLCYDTEFGIGPIQCGEKTIAKKVLALIERCLNK